MVRALRRWAERADDGERCVVAPSALRDAFPPATQVSCWVQFVPPNRTARRLSMAIDNGRRGPLTPDDAHDSMVRYLPAAPSLLHLRHACATWKSSCGVTVDIDRQGFPVVATAEAE